MLTITHTHEAGTLIEGTAKGDGTATILKANRWRWGRSITAWYVPRSRDQFADRLRINRTAEQLRAAGHDVAVSINNDPRDVAAAEADKAAQQTARAAALADKADRRESAAAQAWAADQAAADRLPPDGEPIKVGHHSEGRHRRAIERSWQALGRAVSTTTEAEETRRRAEVAARADASRHNPVTVANRIQRLQADARRLTRQLAALDAGERHGSDSYRLELTQRLEHATTQVEHWQRIRVQQQETGRATAYGPHNVAKGDAVKIRGRWCRVARANSKSVSVETGYSWTDRTPWHEVTDHRAASHHVTGNA